MKFSCHWVHPPTPYRLSYTLFLPPWNFDPQFRSTTQVRPSNLIRLQQTWPHYFPFLFWMSEINSWSIFHFDKTSRGCGGFGFFNTLKDIVTCLHISNRIDVTCDIEDRYEAQVQFCSSYHSCCPINIWDTPWSLCIIPGPEKENKIRFNFLSSRPKTPFKKNFLSRFYVVLFSTFFRYLRLQL